MIIIVKNSSFRIVAKIRYNNLFFFLSIVTCIIKENNEWNLGMLKIWGFIMINNGK